MTMKDAYKEMVVLEDELEELTSRVSAMAKRIDEIKKELGIDEEQN